MLLLLNVFPFFPNIALFQKKTKQEGGVETFFFETLSRIFMFFTLPLENPEITKLHPQKLHKIVLHPSDILRPKTKTPENSTCFFLIAPRNSALFLINPWKFHLLFLQYPWTLHILDRPSFLFAFFWNSLYLTSFFFSGQYHISWLGCLYLSYPTFLLPI